MTTTKMILLGALLFTAACDDNIAPMTTSNQPVAFLQKTRSEPSSADVGEEVAVMVWARDIDGDAVGGAEVKWTITRGDGTLDRATSTTSTDGTALVHWKFGEKVGLNSLRAESGGITIEFSTETRALAPSQTIQLAGNEQFGDAGYMLPGLIAIRLLDKFGNPVGNWPVSWNVTANNGRVILKNPTPPSFRLNSNTKTLAVAYTDDEGIASAAWVLGSEPGRNAVEVIALAREFNEFMPGTRVEFAAVGQ